MAPSFCASRIVSLSFLSISILAEVSRASASLKFETFPFNSGQHLDLTFRYSDLYFILVCKRTKDLSDVHNEYKMLQATKHVSDDYKYLKIKFSFKE